MSHHKPDPNKSITVTIDGRQITVPEGTRILEAAQKAGVHIPTICDHPALGKRAVCRICVVECNGRGKLMTACANDVAEDMIIVTNNARILGIRKMILELLLANHPQECLTCVRNKKCELQSLADRFGIRASPFRHEAERQHPPETDGDVLIRNMNKCIKCGRCVEACQEIQTVRAINSSRRSIHYEISTPYGQTLGSGSCIFCGKCAEVCPVGAIYEHDQSAEVWEVLGSGQRSAAQIVSSAGAVLDDELGLPPGTITPGKMVTALKLLGFEKVFDADSFVSLADKETENNLLDRMKNHGKSKKLLPLITGSTPGWHSFVERFYPELLDHLSNCKSPQQIFAAMVRSSKAISVSITPHIIEKFEVQKAAQNPAADSVDIALTAQEMGRMIRLAGIEIGVLPETPFDSFVFIAGDSFTVMNQNLFDFEDTSQGIKEAELDLKGTMIKVITVDGLARARKVLDSIRSGTCKASLVRLD
ncbi:MAG: 2Fe-2S iron-sulfur cluster-binding protein [Treponema sp.]|nr:2Fe-2S iron-sulfur cluster-binding protein [Treponema sp.]